MSIRLGAQLLAGSSSNDNLSITKNSSNKLQAIGIIDQNDTTKSIKTWVGTRAEYEEIVANDEIDYNTIYNITDDKNITQELLETIYPVGSIYIGTMETCPLAALLGTWTLVSSGRVLQGSDANHAAGTTIEAGLPNITGAVWSGDWEVGTNFDANGAFDKVKGSVHAPNSGSDRNEVKQINFDASRSSSIYGNSDTVQPPAFVVNIWKRVE